MGKEHGPVKRTPNFAQPVPSKRTLLKVTLADADIKATASSVERLMGNKAEARFEFIQEKAEFAAEDLLDV